MRYIEGRNILASVGYARGGASLTITEDTDGVHVTGAASANTVLVYVIPMNTSLTGVINYVANNMIGEPISGCITVTNNASTTLKVTSNSSFLRLAVEIAPGETKIISETQIYKGGNHPQIMFHVQTEGDSVNFVHSLIPYIGFGGIPDTIALNPELTTTPGTSIGSDLINL